ncbi:MAG: hypothetical protein KGN78_13280, partial [Actinomycetales bacterium]|nr:hypothetical protein [Actinomycetales bacterium]
EPVAPVRERWHVPAIANVPMTESELRAAVVARLPKGDDFDGTDEAFFWRVVGRAPVAGDLAAMRTVLEQMDQERRIDFREIAREGAPALWEVFA